MLASPGPFYQMHNENLGLNVLEEVLKVQMTWKFLLSYFKVLKIAVYRFLISFLVPKLLMFKDL